ncbi:MAG: hypothetical protein Kow0092_09830 [Deferrisomatales bacterium]
MWTPIALKANRVGNSISSSTGMRPFPALPIVPLPAGLRAAQPDPRVPAGAAGGPEPGTLRAVYGTPLPLSRPGGLPGHPHSE